MRILLVDDSKTMRNIEKSVLQGLGASAIEEAGDGQDALSRVDAFNPDLILLDWNMPVMDGITFVRTFRGKGRTTPIIMVTTEAEKSKVMEAIQAGVNNYAVKPFTPEVLSKIIQATMAKAAAKKAA
jgi:two-component system, chemotaxis family, chemotaxis protein CheY